MIPELRRSQRRLHRRETPGLSPPARGRGRVRHSLPAGGDAGVSAAGASRRDGGGVVRDLEAAHAAGGAGAVAGRGAGGVRYPGIRRAPGLRLHGLRCRAGKRWAARAEAHRAAGIPSLTLRSTSRGRWRTWRRRKASSTTTSGLDWDSYPDLGDAVLAGLPPENVVLLDIDPPHQKTYVDFAFTEAVGSPRRGPVQAREARTSSGTTATGSPRGSFGSTTASSSTSSRTRRSRSPSTCASRWTFPGPAIPTGTSAGPSTPSRGSAIRRSPRRTSFRSFRRFRRTWKTGFSNLSSPSPAAESTWT